MLNFPKFPATFHILKMIKRTWDLQRRSCTCWSSDYLVKKKIHQLVFPLQPSVTKSFLLAKKWTSPTHHSLRNQRKSNDGNSEKLLERSPMLQTGEQWFWRSNRKGESWISSKKIFNLNFLENALIEFPEIFQSGRPTCGLPWILRRFQSSGPDLEKTGDMQNTCHHHRVATATPMSIKPTFWKVCSMCRRWVTSQSYRAPTVKHQLFKCWVV